MAVVAIVGAGAIGRAYAALVARAGHAVMLWSPSGRGADDLARVPAPAKDGAGTTAVRIALGGKLDGEVVVALASAPAAIASADVVVVAVPATAYAAVLPVLAAHLTDAQVVIFSGALSLAPLWLAEIAAAQGRAPMMACFGTTVATARASPGGVAVMTVRSRLDVAALPARAGDRALAACEALFGARFDLASNALAIALANINPVAHAAMALTNLTRIERGEAWAQYHYLTPAVARLIEAMDGERRGIAAAFGLAVRSVEAHFHRSFDVPMASLAEIAAELHRRRGGPPGPTALATRFVLEDVPYGLAFYEALGRIAAVPTPATSAVTTTLCLLYGQDLRAENRLPDWLGLATSSPAALLSRCTGAPSR